MMVGSYETVVSYMMPLGLHHQFAGGHHYGPEPWYTAPGIRSDWTPAYYHRADSVGLGFDRSSRGTDAVSQYPTALRNLYDDIRTCPEEYLAWFHHVPWDYRMHSGRTFWDELCHRYDDGVRGARRMLARWDGMQRFVDAQRFGEVQHKLRIQARDAVWWRDACLLYFQTFSRRPIPQDVEHPVHNLDEMMRFHLNITNYENPVCGYSR
jgi:alpha-glucuronidase